MDNTPETMSAVIVDAPGAQPRLIRIAKPSAGPGQVLVRIAASGVNPLDLKIQANAAAHAKHPLPAVLGIDLAGRVAAVGEDVTAFASGDEVYGMTGGVGGLQGSLAEYAAVDAALLARKPHNLSMREAASLPLVFITAWEGLVDRAKVQRGQRVLVQGGAGGVGQIVIQLSRAFGASAFAVDDARKKAVLERLGATAIDYRAQGVEEYVAQHTQGLGFDLVYDTVGGAAIDLSFQAVRRFGQVVSSLGWSTHSLAPLSFRAGTYSGVFTLHPLLTGEGRAHHGEILRGATDLIESGKVVPHVDPRRFSLASVASAYQTLKEGSADGKIVVDVQPGTPRAGR